MSGEHHTEGDFPGYKAALQILGWSKASLARRLGIHPNTTTKWGDHPPQYVVAYLKLALTIKRSQASIS